MDGGLPKEKDILLSAEYGLRSDFVTSRNLKRQPKLLSKHQGSQSFTKFRLPAICEIHWPSRVPVCSAAG